MNISGVIIYEIDGSRVQQHVLCDSSKLSEELVKVHQLMCQLFCSRAPLARDDRPLTGSIIVDVSPGKKDSIRLNIPRDTLADVFPTYHEKIESILSEKYRSDPERREITGSINVSFRGFSSGAVRFSGVRTDIIESAKKAVEEITGAIKFNLT